MDEIRFTSKRMTYVVSKFIKWMIKKKLGYNIDIQLNNFKAVSIDGITHVHLDIDAELNEAEVDKILDDIGVED